jgi:23S rRNA (cytosine1962-C5)-methyltransferase
VSRRGKKGSGQAAKVRAGEIAVNDYSERWLRRGFPWVYAEEVVAGELGEPGTEQVVRSRKGEMLGRALTDQGWIAARLYRHDGGPLDAPWLQARLDAAAALREGVVDPRTTGYRLVHGENDGLPGLRVDWWDPYAVLVLDSPAVAPLVEGVCGWLERRRSPRGIYLCYRADPRDKRDLSSVQPTPGLVSGHRAASEVRVAEGGLMFLVRPWDGPDVGLYADMREVRAWLEPHWRGRSVLNTFAFTGAFSVAAAQGGAVEVVSVDLATPALERAEANFVANGLDPDGYEFLAEDTFKALDRFRRTGRDFDLVILDPPAFSRSGAGTWSAKRDWPRLVAAACRVLRPDGWLVAASNQGEISPKEFTGLQLAGFKKAQRRGQGVQRLGQAPDFPAASWFPEGRYLKVDVWRIVE